MQSIWKYKLECTDRQAVALPLRAKVLCAQSQNGEPCIWVINPEVECPDTEMRTFAMYGTGHYLEVIGGVYVGTFQLSGGAAVFHVFEV